MDQPGPDWGGGLTEAQQQERGFAQKVNIYFRGMPVFYKF